MSRILALLRDLLWSTSMAAVDRRALPPSLERASAHVGRRWQTDGPVAISLTGLALAARVSHRQLCREAARDLGTGLARAFALLRLARFATLLTRTNLTVEAAARGCGYRSPFHASRRFSAEYGVAPSAYRAAAAAGMQDLPDPLAGTRLPLLNRAVRESEQERSRGEHPVASR